MLLSCSQSYQALFVVKISLYIVFDAKDLEIISENDLGRLTSSDRQPLVFLNDKKIYGNLQACHEYYY